MILVSLCFYLSRLGRYFFDASLGIGHSITQDQRVFVAFYSFWIIHKVCIGQSAGT